MNLRELINNYRNELASASDLLPLRASTILTELSALKGNILDEIRKRQEKYNQVLLLALDSEKSVARAKILSETSQAFMELKEAKDLNELTTEMIRSLKYFLKEKSIEWQESKNL